MPLESILADDEIALNQDDPRFKPKSQRNSALDGLLGGLSGVAMGIAEASSAPDAILRGDKKAAALRAWQLEFIKPEDLGTAGEFTYGLTKDFTRIGINAGLTAGTGGYLGLGLNSGLFGFQTYEAEKADLLNKGADIDTARKGGAIKGLADAASYAVPANGIFKTNMLADAVATTGAAIGTGIAGDYIEGSVLQSSENKKVAAYGESLQENALSPTSIGINGGMALLLNYWANRGRIKSSNTAAHDQLDAATDAAHVQANIEHAESANPFQPESPKDANAHLDAIDTAMTQAFNDSKVSLKYAVTGAPKALPNKATMARIDPVEFKTIKYNDPRLDGILSRKASELKLDWAVPVLRAIRLAGEKSHNNQVSPMGARSIMQIIPKTQAGLERNNKKKWDIENPEHTTEMALRLVDEIAKTYKTRDPLVIAAHYNGGFANGKAMQRNGKPKSQETINYVNRIRDFLKADQPIDLDLSKKIVKGSDSEFPQFELDIAHPPEYRNQTEAEILALPNVIDRKFIDNDSARMELEDDFLRLQQPLHLDDISYLRDTAHYQPIDGNVNRVPYVEPQVDLTGRGNSARQSLESLDQELDVVQTVNRSEQTTITSEIEQQLNAPENVQRELSNQLFDAEQGWRKTTSDNYVKREMAQQDGSTLQQLHSVKNNTTFERQVNADGTISPVKAMANNEDSFARIKSDAEIQPHLTDLQNKVAQALDREFLRSTPKTEGQPNLNKSQDGEYGSFTSTPDGREAAAILEDNPDMEVTFTRLDDYGNEETVSMRSSELLDYIRDQEEIAKEDITAVKALASCALKFGSEAA